MVSTRSSYRRQGIGFATLAAMRQRRRTRTLGLQTGARRNRFGGGRARKVATSGRGITVQHDSRRMYSKRSMPYKKKRQWKRFVKKVQFVNERDMGTRTVLFSDQITVTDSSPTDQSVFSCALYPQKSTLSFLSDLNQVAALENTGNPTAAAGSTVNPVSHIYFQSGVLDITIRNTSTLLGAVSNSLDPRAQLELDIYEIYCRQDFTTTGSNYASLGRAIVNEGNQELGIGGVTNLISLVKRGATPWEEPTALSRLGVKILKKTKYFVPNNQTVTYQMRDPRRHTSLIREIGDEEGANKPKWTKWLMVIYKLVPGITKGAVYIPGLDLFQEQISIGCTRKYMYKIEGVPENRNRYISSSSSVSSPV